MRKHQSITMFSLIVLLLSAQLFVITSSEEAKEQQAGTILFSTQPHHSALFKNQVTTINLNSDKNLYFHAAMPKPLTQYLQAMESDRSIDELHQLGNYQFSFFLNGEMVYQENMNKGAGLAHEKNKDTLLSKPFFSVANEDSWGRFLWMKFMHFGGEAALREGQNKLRIELRPYIKTNVVESGELIAVGTLEIKKIKTLITDEKAAIQPIQANSGWLLSTEEFNRAKIVALNKKIIGNDFKHITSIAVIKNNKLLLEEYFNNSHREELHNPRSVGKSFASTLIGIAIDDGHLSGVNQRLKDFYNLNDYSNFDSKKEETTIKNLLTMNSVFDGDDGDSNSPGQEENMYPTDNWIKFTLDLPTRKTTDSKKTMRYFTAGMPLLADILDKTVPKGIETYADEKLFKPLGIANYRWQYTPQKLPNMAGGLQLRTLDFAKYGQLYQNEGMWNNQQLVSKKWINESLSRQIKLREGVGAENYGYLFWNKSYRINKQNFESYFASGNGGNKIFIFKNIPLVIVITAKAYNRPYAHTQVDKMIENYILPAVLN